MKNNKGITLIALVITIIVLLILAGVTIAMLTGDNGILTKTNQAKTNTTKGEVADKINMAINAEYASLLSGESMQTAAKIASSNGITEDSAGTGDFTIKVTAPAETGNTVVLKIKPSAKGSYKAYKDDTNLEGTITYSASATSSKYTVKKAEVK